MQEGGIHSYANTIGFYQSANHGESPDTWLIGATQRERSADKETTGAL